MVQFQEVSDIFEIDIRDSLFAHEGNVTIAAKMLCVRRCELWEYIRVRPQLYSIITDGREAMCDMAEGILRDGLRKKEHWAAEFMAETFGYDRMLHGIQPLGPGEVPGQEPDPGRLTAEERARLDEIKRTSKARRRKASKGDPDFVEKLDRAGGNVLDVLTSDIGSLRAAARKLKVTRRQLIDYIMMKPELQAALHSKREELVDECEGILRELLAQRKPWVVKFILRTLGRGRGYCSDHRRRKQAGVEDLSLGQCDLRRLTQEELLEYERLMNIMSGKQGQEECAPTNAASDKPAAAAPTAQTPAAAPTAQTLAAAPQPAAAPPTASPPESTPPPTEASQPEIKPIDQRKNEVGTKKTEERRTDEPARSNQTNQTEPDQTIDLSMLNRKQRREYKSYLRRLFGKEYADRVCQPQRKPPNGVPKDERPAPNERPPPEQK